MSPEEMINQTHTFATLFIKISNELPKNDVLYFYEGIDDYYYYYPLLKGYIHNKSQRGFACDGKENVLRINSLVREGKQLKAKPSQVTLFFVDKDFEKNTGLHNSIYITPCYSIENHYFSDTAFSSIIIGVLKNQRITDTEEDDYQKALNYLKKIRTDMINDVIFANAWLSLLVKDKEKHPCHVLAVRKVKEYNNIKNIRTVAELNSLSAIVSEITDEQVNEEIKEIDKDPINLIRGKYFEQVFHSPFSNLINWTRNENDTFFHNHRSIDIQISEDSLVSIFAVYADVPKELSRYIGNRFSKRRKTMFGKIKALLLHLVNC